MVACGAARYAGRVYVASQRGHAAEAEVARARVTPYRRLMKIEFGQGMAQVRDPKAPPPEFMQPKWFLPVFALMWVGISALLSILGGWTSLAREFRATQRTDGQRFRFVSGSMRARVFPVNYGGCLFVTVNETGFAVSILLLFRILSPPLFIPWSEVASAQTKGFFLVNRAVVRLRGRRPAISVRGAAGRCIVDAYARASRSAPR